ncbi:hypothetical protein HY991_02390 [Candidatus Micrarchaeota archaeon]|nr:hypothetical protein [Candidatus Micrarchaeota archaeon]
MKPANLEEYKAIPFKERGQALIEIAEEFNEKPNRKTAALLKNIAVLGGIDSEQVAKAVVHVARNPKTWKLSRNILNAARGAAAPHLLGALRDSNRRKFAMNLLKEMPDQARTCAKQLHDPEISGYLIEVLASKRMARSAAIECVNLLTYKAKKANAILVLTNPAVAPHSAMACAAALRYKKKKREAKNLLAHSNIAPYAPRHLVNALGDTRAEAAIEVLNNPQVRKYAEPFMIENADKGPFAPLVCELLRSWGIEPPPLRRNKTKTD